MSTDAVLTAADGYTAKNIKILKDAAHIRQNPGMYVGNTQTSGLHHLVYEIVSNSVDEALAGYCTQIRVVIHTDGSISVADNGRGIPVGVKKDTGKSALEEALTIAGKPDPEMFGEITFSYDTLVDRFREIAYLNKGLAISLADERDGRTESFKFDGGIAEYVVWLNENAGEEPAHPPIYMQKEVP